MNASLPPELRSVKQVLTDPLYPSLAVGALSGVAGLVGGGVAGIIVSQYSVAFATGAGLQWFGLGSTFWYVRNIGLRSSSSSDTPNPTSLIHSTVAGSVSGAVNGAFRSRSNIIPGALTFGVLGMLGQGTYNRFWAATPEVSAGPDEGRSFLNWSWIPLKRLSDEDYIRMLNEKAVKLEAEISLIDEKIATLQASAAKDGSFGREETSGLRAKESI